jgi:hypothetical protein
MSSNQLDTSSPTDVVEIEMNEEAGDVPESSAGQDQESVALAQEHVKNGQPPAKKPKRGGSKEKSSRFPFEQFYMNAN